MYRFNSDKNQKKNPIPASNNTFRKNIKEIQRNYFQSYSSFIDRTLCKNLEKQKTQIKPKRNIRNKPTLLKIVQFLIIILICTFMSTFLNKV